MTFITSLFNGNSVLTAIFALGAVIVAIVLVLWLLKLVSGAAGNAGRGRNRRLAVMDSLALDPKRQLLIVRRDNVEHLILTGGSQDLLIESGIVVDEAPAQPTRRPIPMVASRKPAPAAKAAAPVAPAPVAPPVAPAPEPEGPVVPGSAMERLRELGQPTNKKAHLSLRHTGLLRPVNDKEMPLSPENSAPQVVPPADSAKEGSVRHDVEGSDLVEDNSEATRK